ncbi:MAG TPA: hypothetical protein VMS93_03980 [Candidatus Saccharimonadales bacterium]|nr:hypothetical protein [Candidatus Saccharimonadales bacterium]
MSGFDGRGRGPAAAILAAGLLAAAGGPAAAVPVTAAPQAPAAAGDSLPAAMADSLKTVQARRILERAAGLAGGLEAWQATRDVRFQMVMTPFAKGAPGKSDTSTVTFRLHGRPRYREEISDGTVLACDGQRGWAVRGQALSLAPVDSMLGMLQAASVSLWFGVPFRFLDPDFHVTYLGNIAVGGRRCEVVQAVELVPGRSLARSDVYCAYFDSTTGRLLGANFTRVALRENQPRLAAWFGGWVTAGPFQVPSVMRLHKLGEDLLPKLDTPLLEYRRLGIRFDVGAPDSLFDIPRR